jgi:hypothetical protein
LLPYPAGFGNGSICAENLLAQCSYAVDFIGVENPYAPIAIPSSPNHTGSGWKVGVVWSGNGQAILFNNRDRHPMLGPLSMPIAEPGTAIVKMASFNASCLPIFEP